MIDNEGIKSLEYFGVMDGDTYKLEMEKSLASRAVATQVNLGAVQIKGIQDIVWWICDHQTHNQPIIAAEFGQVSKRVVMTGRHIEKEREDTYTKVSGIGKSKSEDFEA